MLRSSEAATQSKDPYNLYTVAALTVNNASRYT
jgi:hypothetical protein